jgi:alkylhydroperoxidase/carboxymuconolactone decarboxylase family protein YurZ
MEQELPRFLQRVIDRYPEIWKRYGDLKEEISSIDALDSRTQAVLKLAIAIGAGREGAVHSHTRRCVREGVSTEELFHTALLAITTIGWSGGIRALSWINDEVDDL